MSDNQGVKEAIFIHTGRRGGDGQLGREDSQQGGGRRTWVGKAAAGGSGKAAAGRAGSPTFACRQTGRNNWGVRQTT